MSKKEIKLIIEHKDHTSIVLTNPRGDTYTSKSEELADFLHDATPSDSDAVEDNQDELWEDVIDVVLSDNSDGNKDLPEKLKSKYHISKK